MRQTGVAQSYFNYTCSLLRKPCISSNILAPSQGRVTGVKLGQEIHREHDFQFALCIQWYVQGYRSSDDIFTHIALKKNSWETRGDHVIMGFHFTTADFFILCEQSRGTASAESGDCFLKKITIPISMQTNVN